MNKLFILSWLVALLVPLALIGLGLRLLLSSAFLQFEYNMPYFPADEYGFTKDDRLRWAPYAVEYLVNDADVSYLGSLYLPSDESCLCRFHAPNPESVRRINELAGVPFARIVAVIELVAKRKGEQLCASSD